MAIVTAASAAFADVSAAVTRAVIGDTVAVPAGVASWPVLPVAKGISIIGAGIGKTLITGTADRLVAFSPNAATRAAQAKFRLSGFTLKGSSFYGVVALEESNGETVPIRNVRIDHNRLENSSGYPIYVDGNFWGVVDNNQFAGAAFFFFLGNQGTSWAQFYPASYGTADNLYFEDNVVSGAGWFGIQAEQGGRFAWRHNAIDRAEMGNPAFDQHGNQAGDLWALMLCEIYENTFKFNTGVNRWDYQRGGKLLMFNNSGTSPSGTPNITVHDDVDSTAPPIQWPYDDHFWNNVWNGARIDAEEGVDAGNHIAENVTFWNEKDGFDGKVGIGRGLLAARPATCSVGVGYWATDEQTLYKATAANTWTPYFKPYTYPHPLRAEDGGSMASKSITFNLVVTAVSDFFLAVAPATLEIHPGNTATYTISVSGSGGYAKSLNFALTGLPAGCSGTFAPATITAGQSTVLTITTPATLAVGSYTITATATEA